MCVRNVPIERSEKRSCLSEEEKQRRGSEMAVAERNVFTGCNVMVMSEIFYKVIL